MGEVDASIQSPVPSRSAASARCDTISSWWPLVLLQVGLAMTTGRVIPSVSSHCAMQRRFVTSYSGHSRGRRAATDQAEVRRLLTFVVVGGGPSGVELAGSIRELGDLDLASRLPTHPPRSGPGQLCLRAGPSCWPAFRIRLASYAQSRLERMGVEIHLRTAVETVDAEGVVAGGKCVPATCVFWCAGVAATRPRHGSVPPRASTGQCGSDLIARWRVSRVFAIGDVAEFQGPDGSRFRAWRPSRNNRVATSRASSPLALPARPRRGVPLPGPGQPGHHRPLDCGGQLAHLKITGRPAWLLWAGVHLLRW